jgi:linoleoyl-CoA desaturase
MKDPEFINELRIRVNDYFEKRKISKFGNGRMVVKSVVMLSMYFVPYFFILFSGLSNVWGMFALWITMGFGMAGIGMSVMHDANHGSYFNNPKINNFIGHIIFFIGGSSLTWKIQHNHLHHAFTNVQGADKDLETVKFLRFSPHQKRKKIHRLQFIYAWFFYGLMTLSRYFITDYKQIFMFKKMGLTNRQKQSFGTLFSLLVFTKVFYAILILGLPMMLSGVLWWQTVLFFLSMHFISGFILGIVFQPAHVMPDTKFPLPNEDGNLDNNWGIHQLLTTTNFGPKSNIFSWFVGGLNFQIEHHLFPGISHVHYKKISKLVKGTALEYGLPYNSQPNFIMALWNHEKMLFNLGKASYRANV